MPILPVHSCQCPHCLQEDDHPEKRIHTQMNLVLSRLDEQQRRWFIGFESGRDIHRTDVLLSQITGIDEKTIARGRQELAANLEGRPTEAVRLPGGGRPSLKKKTGDRSRLKRTGGS